MKKIIIIVAVLVVLAVAGFFGYRALGSGAPTPEATLEAGMSLPNVVSAESFVVPAFDTDLSFEAGGQVVELPVKEGDSVEAGQLLARLDATDQEVVVMQAEAGVEQAKAGVEQAGASLEQAKAAVQSAKARLARTRTGPTKEEIAQAEAAVQTAGAELNRLMAGARPEEVERAAASLLQAEADLKKAQADYDKIAWAKDVSETQEAVMLEKATLAYNIARAQYQQLLNGATVEEIEVQRARVAEAEAALATVKAGATDEDVAIAEAQLAEAEAALVGAEAGVTNARAALTVAEASLASAKNGLSYYEIVAPVAGTVAKLNMELGEFVAAGTPVVTIADISEWYVDTDDLNEVDVIHVHTGQEVKITIDALPDEEFTGVVTEIAPRSETKRGDVTYTVTVKFTGLDEEHMSMLRWGMTAFVDFPLD